MGQWYINRYNSKIIYSWIYIFDSYKNINVVSVLNHVSEVNGIIVLDKWSRNDIERMTTKSLELVPIKGFICGLVHIVFSDFNQRERLIFEIERGKLYPFMDV